MIKLDYTTVKNKDNVYAVECNGCVEGKREVLVAEMSAVLDSFEEYFPEVFMEALDNFLKRKGF